MNTTLILGNGPDAQAIARARVESGTNVLWVLAEADGETMALNRASDARTAFEIYPLAGPFDCSGSEGRYAVSLEAQGTTVNRTVSQIVLADAVCRKPNFALYGIAPSTGVVSISQLRAAMESANGASAAMLQAKHVALISGLASDGHPVNADETMRCALRLQQEFGRQTYVLTGNLKVAGNGLEALYRRTKQAGVVYLKFAASLPGIRQHTDGTVTITGTDEIIQEPFRLTPDLTVVDERFEPSAFTRQLARQLSLETGPDGFAQADNVHRSPVCTNRKNIFVAGGSKGVQTERARQADIGSVLVAMDARAGKAGTDPQMGKAVVDTGQCVRCLTCVRLCPYGAISLDSQVVVDPSACEGCGICAAECPRFAVTIDLPEDAAIAGRIPKNPPVQSESFIPMITAFCCNRSAVSARELAACMGHRLPEGLRIVPVPCAGGISRTHIVEAFRAGADGVMVLSCHPDNCHSGHGNIYAHQRVAQIAELMPRIGLKPQRLAYRTFAANMGTEFAEALNAFEGQLIALGPSRLRANEPHANEPNLQHRQEDRL